MTMRALDRAVLVRHAAVNARWFHVVVRAQCIIALRQVLARVAVKIVERG